MSYNFKQVNILIVEHSAALAQLMQDTLNVFTVPRANIHYADSMQDGFTQFCMMNHDLIVTNWLSEPDTGIHLTRLIRTHPDSPNRYVPIIMAAGSAHLRSVLAARDAGVSEYLVMPFGAKDLARKITRVIEHPRSFVVASDYVGPDRRIGIVEEPYTGPERRASSGKKDS